MKTVQQIDSVSWSWWGQSPSCRLYRGASKIVSSASWDSLWTWDTVWTGGAIRWYCTQRNRLSIDQVEKLLPSNSESTTVLWKVISWIRPSLGNQDGNAHKTIMKSSLCFVVNQSSLIFTACHDCIRNLQPWLTQYNTATLFNGWEKSIDRKQAFYYFHIEVLWDFDPYSSKIR